jgi:hypothetical protein
MPSVKPIDLKGGAQPHFAGGGRLTPFRSLVPLSAALRVCIGRRLRLTTGTALQSLFPPAHCLALSALGSKWSRPSRATPSRARWGCLEREGRRAGVEAIGLGVGGAAAGAARSARVRHPEHRTTTTPRAAATPRRAPPQVALVTGGSSGIGFEITRQLGARRRVGGRGRGQGAKESARCTAARCRAPRGAERRPPPALQGGPAALPDAQAACPAHSGRAHRSQRRRAAARAP